MFVNRRIIIVST